MNNAISGTSGYILFPNNLCLQFGRVNPGATFTFSKAFADTNYSIASGILDSTSENGIKWTNASWQSRTATSMKLGNNGVMQSFIVFGKAK